MNSNKFRRLRPLASASPAQTAQPLLPELRQQAPPKRTTEGIAMMCAAETPRRRPHLLPKRTTEGIATMCAAETSRLRPHPPPKRTTEGIATMREFPDKNKTSVELPPIYGPSQAKGLHPFPPVEDLKKPIVVYGISTIQLEADFCRQQSYSEFLKQDRKLSLCPQCQHPSQKKSASPERKLKATKAPDANGVQLKRKEPEALERKVSEPTLEMEEMDLTETEEPEEENSNPEEMDRVMDLEDSLMWEYKWDEMYENIKVKCHQDKIEKMNKKVDRIKAKIVRNGTLIHQKQKGLKTLQVIIEKNPIHKIVAKIMKIKQISEKMAEVHEKSFGEFCCPEFLVMMMMDFEESSIDLEENTPAETLREQQKEFWRGYYKNIRVKKQEEFEALNEDRWQRRREQSLERALAPPVKISGKKLMPRSLPPKKVKETEG